jgi:4-amino-4-deoxy-L-arabinose transferase-like glycosyltransferase
VVWAATAAATLLALFLLLPALGTFPFDDPGEGQHAEIAREAWMGGGWLTLHLNGVRYLDKPPLLYAGIAGAFALWGPSEWAARLPAVLGAGAAVAATAVLGGRLLGPAAGLAAAAALLGSILFVAFSRYVRPETLFVAALQWGLTGLLLSQPASRAWALVGGAALGLAALAKDPLGLVAPLAVVALAGAGARPRAPRRRWWPGVIAVALAVGLGWYVLAALASPGFVWYTVVDNHLLNAARARRFPDEDVPLSSLEFLAVSGLGAFPWVLGAAASVASLARRRAWRDPAETPWVALGLWATGVLAVFALSPFKLPHYGLPAYPAIALLAVRWWLDPGRGRRGMALHAVAFAALAVLCGAAAAGDGRLFSDTVLSATDVETRKEAAAGVASAPAIAWADLQPMLARITIVFGAGAAALALATARRLPRLGLAATLATMLACVPAVSAGLAHVATGRSVRGLALAVAREAGPGTLVLHEGPIEQSGALEFYSGRRPILVDGTRSVLGFGASFADASEQFWDRARVEREWASGRPMLLVTPRAPARSVVGSLPTDRIRLVLEENGRRLYASRAPASPRRWRRRTVRAPAP